MWAMAHRRKDFDKINTNSLDDDHYSLVQNFFTHREMPFGLSMPTSKEIFTPLGKSDAVGEAIK